MTSSSSSMSVKKKKTLGGTSGGVLRVKKVKTVAQLKKKLDEVFSKHIRTKFSREGKCACYTCSKVFLIKDIQCGHFVSRTYTSVRWDENNCRPQCVGCNIFGGGRPLDFEEHLVKDIGVEKVNELKRARHTVVRLTHGYLQDLIETYA